MDKFYDSMMICIPHTFHFDMILVQTLNATASGADLGNMSLH